MHLFLLFARIDTTFLDRGKFGPLVPRNGAAGFLAGCGSVLLTQPQVMRSGVEVGSSEVIRPSSDIIVPCCH